MANTQQAPSSKASKKASTSSVQTWVFVLTAFAAVSAICGAKLIEDVFFATNLDDNFLLHSLEALWPNGLARRLVVGASGICLVVLAILFGRKAYKLFEQRIYLRAERQAGMIEHMRTIVLPVSWPNRQSHSSPDNTHTQITEADLIALTETVAGDAKISVENQELEQAGVPFNEDPLTWLCHPRTKIGAEGKRLAWLSWQTGLATLRDARKEGGFRVLSEIVLVPTSPGTDQEKGTSEIAWLYEKLIKNVLDASQLGKTSEGQPYEPLKVSTKTGYRHNNFEDARRVLQEILEEHRDKNPEGSICFDITGGAATYSALCALLSADPEIFYSYVSEDGPGLRVHCYDVRRTEPPASLGS